MKKRNVIALAGVALLSAGILAACSGGSKSSSSSNGQKFSYVYETEPENLTISHLVKQQPTISLET